jgi:hypothetical protein
VTWRILGNVTRNRIQGEKEVTGKEHVDLRESCLQAGSREIGMAGKKYTELKDF